MKAENMIFNTWVPHPYLMTEKEVEFKNKIWERRQSICLMNEGGYCGYIRATGAAFDVFCSMKNCKMINYTSKAKSNGYIADKEGL